MKLKKVTKNGRITIPAKPPKKHNLHPRRKVKYELEEDGVKIISLATPEEIESNIGFLGTNGIFLKALMGEKLKVRR